MNNEAAAQAVSLGGGAVGYLHELGGDSINYLITLVRRDIRKHQKDVDRFTPRPEQNPVDAAEVLAKFIAGQEFRHSVLQQLVELSKAHKRS